MKKIFTLLFALFLAVTASGQSHIFPAYDSNNVFTGSNTFQGPFFLPSIGTGCLAVGAGGVITVSAGCGGAGLTSFMTRTTPAAVLLASDVNSVLATLTNCTTAGYTYSPASNTCIISSSAVFPTTNGLVFNTSTTLSRTATPGTDYDNFNLGQLNNFRAALANASNADVNIVLVGDNDVQGLGATTLSNSMYYQLQTYFSPFNSAGPAGTGIIPVFGNGAGVTLNREWTQTGTLTSSADLGPTQATPNAFNSTAILTGTGTSVTLNAISGYNTLTIYGETSTDTANGCSVVVNGGSPHIVGNTTTGSPGVYKTAIALGSTGTWTTVISGTSSGNCRLYGAEFSNASVNGVEIHRLAHAASTSGAWGSNVAAQLAYIGSISPAPQLAVIMLGRYDNINSASLSTTTANFTNLVSQLRVINPQMAVIFMDEPPMNTNGTGITPAQIKTLEQSFGFTANTAYISLGDSFGTYANANAIGAMAGDGININDKGSLYAASLLTNVLTEGQTPGVNAFGFATLQANTFLGMQTIINPTLVPDIAFASSASGADEGLAWYDGPFVYPSTTSLRWKMGKDVSNNFYGYNQTLASNWLTVNPATNAVNLNGDLNGVHGLNALTVSAATATFTNISVTSTASIANLTTGPISSGSTVTLLTLGATPDTGMELYVPPTGSPTGYCFTMSGGCTFASGSHINGFLYNGAGGGNLEMLYGAGLSTDKLSFFSNAIGTGGSGAIVFDASGNIQITQGFLNYDQATTATPAVTGIGSSPVCQAHVCSIQGGIINVGIDGSSTGGNFLTLTSSQTRPTSLSCYVSAPQDPGSSLSATVSGTSTTIVTFNLLNGSTYNTAAKTMKIQYNCSIL